MAQKKRGGMKERVMERSGRMARGVKGQSSAIRVQDGALFLGHLSLPVPGNSDRKIS
jgi:hypothetical protein